MPTPAAERLTRARVSLEGLSVGDAFGQRFFHHRAIIGRLWLQRDGSGLDLRQDAPLGPPPWRWTDDTAMALSVVEVLQTHETADQDRLARHFAERFHEEPRRGYGPAMHRLLPDILRRRHWRDAARQLFSGQGSFGNGAAMRVAPLGAYFADDLDQVVAEAQRSAEVTHAHAEGVAGAIAVAGAAAWAWRSRQTGRLLPPDFIGQVLALVPDMDTTCAIVGGIVALYTGLAGIPAEWRASREPLPPGFASEAV
ncbi:MAG TPA: ADP-ribosylglycohydrolase family protein [Chloroflexia bacterium]|nr:ADP-ribosylglycohydrolase family protein [Chloroflexia bacterium]